MTAGNPILITGSHRSGTTWTGKTIALSPKVVYLQEPFNKDYYSPGICRAYFATQFFYITQDNEAGYFDSLRRTANLQYNWRAALKMVKHPRELAPVVRMGLSFMHYRLRGRRPLFKDPFALLSAEWLVERFNMIPIILIRHPAAFTGSVKRFSWESPVEMLLQQPLLMRDYLHPMRAETEQFLSTKRTIVELAAQFWKMLYYVVDIYRQRHPDWLFIRHEDLSRSPLNGFRQIFDYLSLPYTNDMQTAVKNYTNPTNPRYSTGHTDVTKLNSQANIWSWRERLTPTEIERVGAITSPVAQLFYSDDEWLQ